MSADTNQARVSPFFPLAFPTGPTLRDPKDNEEIDRYHRQLRDYIKQLYVNLQLPPLPTRPGTVNVTLTFNGTARTLGWQ